MQETDNEFKNSIKKIWFFINTAPCKYGILAGKGGLA
jgi:hypothetical protein